MKVKICGITHPDDAYFAATAGADYIGLIFAKKSKRLISLSQAKEIQSAIKTKATELVAVFAEESLAEILEISQALGLKTLQLHGDVSREQLQHLQNTYQIFYAVPYQDGHFSQLDFSNPVLPLYDHHQAGSGQTFNQKDFSPPKRPWILAGGLNKDNVSQLIQQFHPSIVDVSSGVELAGTVRKDPVLVKAFIEIAMQEKKS